jgi:hypothetical protein
MRRAFILALALAAGVADPAAAQPAARDPKMTIDLLGGYAGFIDESLIDHAVIAPAARFRLSRTISIGPEVVYMVGPGHDRDLFLTGNVTFDFLTRTTGARRASVNPFLVVGGGLMRHSTRFGTGDFTSVEGAVTGGGGVRIWITERTHALAEYRVGWEPHVRVTGGIGIVW